MKNTLLATALVAATLLTTDLPAQPKTIVETAIASDDFNTLVAAVKAADLVDTLNGHSHFTVFAPTDEAFAKLDEATLQSLLKPENKGQLKAVLTYHVLPGRVTARDAYDLNSLTTVSGQRLPIDLRGDSLKVGESTIKVTDIQCSNGVIHVIDSVLLPKLNSIPETARAAGQFNTLLAAVDAAGLSEVLSGPGPFTVFAPTDDAFAALPEGTVEALLKSENKQQLVDILKYHVVSGRVFDNEAVKAGRAKTLLGSSVDVKLSAEGISVNDASLVAKNIQATNGVVHVIDSVLIPSQMSREAVMTILTDAIERGVPIYNSGHHRDCCTIYMDALESISAAGVKDADEHTMSTITKALGKARNTHSMTTRAWVLRHAIDSVYARMKTMPELMETSTRTIR